MTKINFQFHALRNETISYIINKVKEYNLNIIAINSSFPELSYKIYNSSTILYNIINNAEEVLLMADGNIIKATSYIDFLSKNKGFLSVCLGKECDEILGESRMAGTAEGETLLIWRKIVNQYKRKMNKGAWGIAEWGGERKYYSSHMYTDLAKEKYEKGSKICAFAGNCIFELENKISDDRD
ncbi:MAG: hypothetical protein HDR22_08575 [Lachnospiraceae bacterium]|nr:hypothetical protein [Lachnospiraceae bacterium]